MNYQELLEQNKKLRTALKICKSVIKKIDQTAQLNEFGYSLRDEGLAAIEKAEND